MSITIIKENTSTSYVEQRKIQVAEITRKHSQNLFGHPYASIEEIRIEAVKRRLESIFNK